MESINFHPPPPLIGTLEKQNLNKFCDYHGDRGHNTNDFYQLKAGKRHPPEQSEERKPRKERRESHKHDKWWKKPQETVQSRKIRFNRRTHLPSNSSELLDRRTNHIGSND
ncbi:hypothetical protein Tco_1048836 [Tanacetum coccineum]